MLHHGFRDQDLVTDPFLGELRATSLGSNFDQFLLRVRWQWRDHRGHPQAKLAAGIWQIEVGGIQQQQEELFQRCLEGFLPTPGQTQEPMVKHRLNVHIGQIHATPHEAGGIQGVNADSTTMRQVLHPEPHEAISEASKTRGNHLRGR